MLTMQRQKRFSYTKKIQADFDINPFLSPKFSQTDFFLAKNV